jgi:hypothetical protein
VAKISLFCTFMRMVDWADHQEELIDRWRWL